MRSGTIDFPNKEVESLDEFTIECSLRKRLVGCTFYVVGTVWVEDDVKRGYVNNDGLYNEQVQKRETEGDSLILYSRSCRS